VQPAAPAGARNEATESPAELRDALIADVRLDHVTRLRVARRLLAAVRLVGGHEDGWPIFGVTSFAQLCEQVLGLSCGEGYQLRAAAEACERSEELARRVESGAISLPKAAAVARVLEIVQEWGEEERLLDLAVACTKRQTWAEVSRIQEQARIAQRPIGVTVQLSREAVGHLERARDLLTDGRGGPRPTQSHAVEVALEEFVDRHCPERKARRAAARDRCRAERSRPADPPPGPEVATSRPVRSPPSRRIPAREAHAVVSRHGDVCWVDGCEERGALQFAHDLEFRFKGSNRATNLARYCLHHHREFDSGRIKLRQGRDGPILVSRSGQVVGRLRDPPPA